MSAFSGPEISTSGLIFYYDVNNTEKSWKGKPTTNLLNPSWAVWSVDGSGQGNIGTRTINSTYYCTISDVNQNTRQSTFIEGISANTTYTFSVKYKKISGTPTLRFQIQAYNGGSYISTMSFATTAELGITDKEDWQTASITLTTPANTTRILWFMQDGDDYATYTHSFELKEVQMEAGSIYSPFVDGTRSNTQAILDLTGQNTITAQNLTYNSNGTFSWSVDVDARLQCPASSSFAFGTGDFTIDCWINPTNFNGYTHMVALPDQNTFGLKANTGDGAIYFYSSEFNSYPITGWTLTTGTWNHVTLVRNASVAYAYLNGTLKGSKTGFNNNFLQQVLNIGNGWNGEYTSKSISNVKIYNRALSANEVAQNFQALRGRYGV
jgi:hypothetical protein